MRSSFVFALSLLLCIPLQAQDASPHEALNKALSDSDENVRRDAAYDLAKLGPEAKVALPALIKAVADDDEQVSWVSMQTIARIGPEAAGAVPALIRMLDNREEQFVYRAAFALGNI